ncbi:hypothetical protein [Cohnella soli]|uniref:Uncharacterized protein n=1 Tax=Cohnella soli TaxID=425005 RepID=A0ABW0HPU4_9BACL
MAAWTKWRFTAIVVALGAAGYFVLLQKARSMNIFVPLSAFNSYFISTFAVYAVIVGVLSLWLFVKFKTGVARVSLIAVFYIVFYFFFLAMNIDKINGFAP